MPLNLLCACLASGWFQLSATRAVMMAASITGLGVLTACTALSPKLLATTQAEPAVAQTASLKLPEEVRLKTNDGWTIVGDLYVPSGSARGAIVLLHQRGGSAYDWRGLATALQKSGFIALAIDQRGAGRSTQGPEPTGDDAPWLTSEDIATAIASLPKQLPIGLAGASYGANNALIYAAAHPNQIKGLALFSPGANYHSLDALAAARSYHAALVIYHSQDDSTAGVGPKQINGISPSPNHRLQVLSGNAHGTELINPGVISDVVKFFQSSLKQ